MIPRGWTVRTRLALLHGALFLLGGIVLLGVTLTLTHRALADQPVDLSIVLAHPGSVSEPDAAPQPDTAGLAKATGSVGPVKHSDTGSLPSGEPSLADRLQADFRNATMRTLLTQGLLALVGVALVGAWIGWLMAGRTLRPVTRITATARRVAAGNLNERIALGGPRDELRELADTFDDMLSRLDTAFNAQRRFVANASHELRTPVAISRTLLEVAMSRPQATPDLVQVGRSLLTVHSRQERLIESLLTLARSEQMVADPVPVELTTIVRSVVDAARPEAEANGVTITTELLATSTVGSPVLLERLVENLVQNAVRYNRKQGWVRVECQPVRGRSSLTITNTGPVVGDDEVDGLFEPFRRLDDRVGSAEGSGLGLSIVRSVARAHGGAVAAAPREGGGLTISIDLPGADHRPACRA